MSSEDVVRAMRGDHDAFAALVGAATSRLYALASLILRDSGRAEDATQEAFVTAWRELPRLRDVDRFDAWLRRLLVNACYDEARRINRRSEVGLFSLGDRSVVDISPGHDMPSNLAQTDRIERAFRQLPFEQRTVLVLQHYFDLSHAEIAETVGIPVATVKSRVRYGIAAMRAALDSDDRPNSLAAGRKSA
jgi:RNA polymerase sigma-70 factor (ECF subfamily)